MKPILQFIVLLLLFSGCREKNNKGPVEEPVPPPVTTDTGFKCMALPPPPPPFGWKDSTIDVDKNITAFIFNPANANEIIFIVEGNMFGYNKLFTYNVVTKTQTFLANLGSFLPSINKKGWIVYSSPEDEVFKIKANGDSIKMISTGNSNMHPEWESSGNHIYYFREAYLNLPATLIRQTIIGPDNTFQLPVGLPQFACFKNSDEIIYFQSGSATVTLIRRNMSTQVETTLISGPYNSKTGEVHFKNLCLDNTDQNMYWSNSLGIFRCNLTTLKIDTLLKNCENTIFNNPLASFKGNELTVSMHTIKPTGPHVLFHQFKAMECNLSTGKLSEVRIFP